MHLAVFVFFREMSLLPILHLEIKLRNDSDVKKLTDFKTFLLMMLQ